jgi:hypothetical protein
MTKRSQRNALIEQLWKSNSACAAGTALLAAPIALTKSILFVNQESTEKFYLDRTVRAEAPKSENPIAIGDKTS